MPSYFEDFDAYAMERQRPHVRRREDQCKRSLKTDPVRSLKSDPLSPVIFPDSYYFLLRNHLCLKL